MCDDVMGQSDLAPDFLELVQILRDGGRRIALSVGVCVLIGLGFCLFLPEKFESSATVVLANSKGPGGLSQFADLASVAGIDLGGNGGSASSQPLAVLKSDSLLKELVDSRDLLPVIFANKWNEKTKHWNVNGEKIPDDRNAVDYLKKKVRTVVEDKKAGTITINFEWKNPDQAALWCNDLVRLTNARMRREAIQQSSEMTTFLENELGSNANVAVQQAISRVIEAQLEKMAFAKANEQFALKFVDEAVPARKRSSPKAVLILGFSLFAGLMIAGVSLFLQKQNRENRL
jgi:hypothetical protein